MKAPSQDARLIPWESFRAAFIEPGVPANVPVEGEPTLYLYTDKEAERLGLRAEASGNDLTDLQTPQAVHIDGNEKYFAIWAEDPEMFEPFYAFLLDVANRLQLSHASVREAIGGAVAAWRRMLAAPRLMGHEERLGLLGELWILERLIRSEGPKAFVAWTGAQREVHDFRVGGAEIEVKSTLGSSRTHIVGSAHQLIPSKGMRLYLASVHFEKAGLAEGWTLPEQIGSVRDVLRDSDMRADFASQLTTLGWLDADSAYYPDRFRLRSEPTLIPVDGAFPRITDDELRNLLGDRLDRISAIRYSIDVDGLGTSYPSDEFLSVLPLSSD